MGSSKRYAKSRTKKRKSFNGKRFAEAAKNMEQDVIEEPQSVGASSKKLDTSAHSLLEEGLETFQKDCNFFMESELFMSLIIMIASCLDCAATINIKHLLNEKMGLAHYFDISCVACPWKIKFCSSKVCDKVEEGSGRKGFEINRRAIIAFIENSLGFTGMETFCRCMNMPSPMAKTTFEDISCSIHNAYVESAQESMKKAADEARTKAIEDDMGNADEDDVVNISVSGDGAWQKRGFSSLNGVMTLITNGKCVDTEVMSKKCRLCDVWGKKLNTEEYAKWKESHQEFCSLNHEGSSGAMEITGLNRLFKRSVNLYNLRYTFYIGDGDSKSFSDMCNSNPYPGYTIEKGECIGHVQKRVGTHLRKINEALNNLIWTRCPKRIYVGNSTFKTAVSSAVISFNDGQKGLLSIFKKLGIEPGYFTITGFEKTDVKHVKESDRKAQGTVKQRRKKLRAVRKGFEDKNNQEEGEMYGYGAF